MSASQPAACWSFTGLVATSPDGSRLDLDAPGRGLVLPDGGDSLLGVDLRTSCRPQEEWLRGSDVIAVYEPADPRRLRATAMWRLHPVAAAGVESVWELTLSAQTALVQSDAALAVTCDIGGLDLRWRAGSDGDGWTAVRPGEEPPPEASRLLVRRPAGPRARAATVLVAVHPADARRIVVRRHDGRIAIACWLFSTAIEKGVLMRGRVLAAIGPSQGDEDWAGRLVSGFEDSPPPLTA